MKARTPSVFKHANNMLAEHATVLKIYLQTLYTDALFGKLRPNRCISKWV